MGQVAPNAARELTIDEYETLKGQGALPGSFHVSGNTAMTPMKDGKPIHPAGSAKGGGLSVCSCWLQPDASYSLAMPPNDDGSSALINLPFQYNLYGQLFNQAYINNNGNVSFNNSYGTFSSFPFPDPSYVMVAPFWADVDTRGSGCAGPGGGQIWYKLTPTALYVNWDTVGYYGCHVDKHNTFQLIITNGNDPVIGIGKNTSFCYKTMEWTTGDASGGSNGFGGTPATVGANLGNGVDYIQFTRTDHAGIDYDGPFGNNDGVGWLSNQNFAFNTEVFTSNIPPIGGGTGLCDTLVACVGVTTPINFTFLSPEPGQITTIVATAPSSSWHEILNQSGNTATLTGEIIPTLADTGYYTLTIQGTDNGVPPLTSTYNIVVHVLVSAVMIPGSLAVCDNGAAVDMYSLLGGAPLPGGTWVDPGGFAHPGTFVPGTDTSGIYVYSIGSGTACPSIGQVTMTEVSHADAGIDAVLAKCSSDPLDPLFPHLTGTPQSGGAWIDPNGAPFSGTLHPATDAQGVYHYVVYGTAPCPNDTSHITVTIPKAVHPGASAALNLCADAAPLNMRLALNGTPDTTGAWTAPGGAAFTNTFVAATDQPGVYTYTVTAVAPCPTLSSTLTLSVDPVPFAGNDGSLAICADGAITPLFPLLGGVPNTGGHWLDPLGGAHNGILHPALQLSGNYTYVAIGIGACTHLSDSARVAVDVNPLPIVRFTVDPDSGCNPLRVTFTNTTDSSFLGGSCIWDLGDGTTGLNECGTFEHIYNAPGWYNVNLTITTPAGCVDHHIVAGAVLVEAAPTAEFVWTPDPGTEFNSNIYFSALNPNAIVFNWTIAGTDTAHGRHVYHDFQHVIGGTYEVCLNVADRYGCVDSLCDTVRVIVPTVYVPNAFTPNGDGVNDVFIPITRDMVADDHELMIFDRWGELVFETTDPMKGWNGKYNSGGEVLPQSVYVWHLVERKADTSDKKDWYGTITLLK